jgi:hypothetical protein
MLMIPELVVALRRELTEALTGSIEEAIALSTWNKARPHRARQNIAALQKALLRPLTVVLWQKGAWTHATEARDTIGGELTTGADMEPVGQLWLFESVTLPTQVRQRFALHTDARIVGRILLPLEPPEVSLSEPSHLLGLGTGFLFRSAHGVPFLRLLPDLYPGEFLVDPHVNFVAARRYLEAHAEEVTPPGDRARGGRVLSVPGE